MTRTKNASESTNITLCNLSSFKDDNWEVRYVYDMVDKLKRTEGDLSEHFVFDPAGNLLGQQKSDTGKTTRGNRLQMQGDRNSITADVVSDPRSAWQRRQA